MIPRVSHLILFFVLSSAVLRADLQRDAIHAIERGTKYFATTSVEGGYGWYVTTDLKQRWGEGDLGEKDIEIQPPGTPSVGMAMLRAYEVTEYNPAMRAAKAAAEALIKGQNELGGWSHVVRFDGPNDRFVSFDDDQTQSALSFLMAMERKFKDDTVWKAVERGLNLMTSSQLSHGGWPHRYPRQGNYHDYATFNDQGINDCIRVMIEADSNYANPQLRNSLLAVARFLMISQLPPPQPGWAQQYNQYLQPAWARSFEPPAVCPSATLHNLNSLMDLAVHLNDRQYLEPIHDALRWLDDTQLPNGLWARFVEIGTGKALYYDLGRIRVDSTEELSTDRRYGYGYETDLSAGLEKAKKRFDSLWNRGQDLDDGNNPMNKEWFMNLERRVKEIIDAQDSKGRWVTEKDRFKKRIPGQRWNGEYVEMDRISSRVFIDNIETLADYVDIFRRKKVMPQ
ncbi:MAG: hypothetical protein KJT03_06300 [Verrucomicrobiae bacterium]|nr:hypothetical protein [Verrucomicrobiae bacterium]